MNSWSNRPCARCLLFPFCGMRTKRCFRCQAPFIYLFSRDGNLPGRHNKITVPTTSKFNSRRIRRSLSYTLYFLSHPQGFADIRKQFSGGGVGSSGTTTANFYLPRFLNNNFSSWQVGASRVYQTIILKCHSNIWVWRIRGWRKRAHFWVH